MRCTQVKPADAACIIETDCNVDFDAPVGYEEHLRKLNASKDSNSGSVIKGGSGADDGGALAIPAPVSGKAAPAAAAEPLFVPFTGGGARLDGKAAPVLTPAEAAAARLAAAERRASSASTGSNGGSSSSSAAAAAAAKPAVVPGVAPPAPRKVSAAGQFAKRKLQTGAFQGQGNSLA
jgi:ubiquitin fusion degradation protein 1